MLDWLIAEPILRFADRHRVFEGEKTNFLFWYSLFCGFGEVLLLWGIVYGITGRLPVILFAVGVVYFLLSFWTGSGIWDMVMKDEEEDSGDSGEDRHNGR